MLLAKNKKNNNNNNNMKPRPIFPVVQTQSHPGHLIQISQVCDSLQVSLLRHLEEKGGYEIYKEFAGLNLAHIISLSHTSSHHF